MSDEIDFTEFYDLLLNATRKTFVFTRECYPDETFYAFGLTYKMTHTVKAVCNTEQEHQRRGGFTETDRRNQTLKWAYSRWHPSDWLYPAPGRNYFGPVTQWLQTHMGLRQQVKFEPASAERAAMKNGFLDSCFKALKALDHEGMFGQGEARDAVTAILLGEFPSQPDSDQDYVYRLNSASTYERWRFEWELCRHARVALSPDRFE